MNFEVLWTQISNAFHQFWIWVRYEASLHPFMTLGVLLIIILGWVLHKGESTHK